LRKFFNADSVTLKEELKRRRTFGIISHPDAGKTTLTEKLLLFGGAITTAGAVKSNKISKHATSDFMEIEKQRGISVSTSVMGFEYSGLKQNLLDTPGHQDFAEDTYRTLTAVDSVIMIIDCVKGVEIQTEKLMEVCRMRNTPVISFINKLDREGQDPFALLDEIENKLSIKVRPLSWPIGMGKSFKGVYSLFSKSLILFAGSRQKIDQNDFVKIDDINSSLIDDYLGNSAAEQLRTDVEWIEGIYPELDVEAYRNGTLAPVFFGSAVNNFGVQELLNCFINIAPEPQARSTEFRTVKPDEDPFSGFVFKIHANIDPRHRNRIAFLRVCSGKFVRKQNYHHVRQGRKLRFSNATAFMAQSKETIDEAFPGDIVGLYDTGNLKIGDTLSAGDQGTFKGIPSFSPEIFKEVINLDAMKTKQLDKGLRQLMDEGVAQLFTYEMGKRKVVGTVGQLQFEVIQHRLKNEYGAACRFNALPLYKACWISSKSTKKLQEFIKSKYRHIAHDKEGKPVFMAETKQWLLMVQESFPDIEFHFFSEFN
jgi:peptide chain release factor 3